MDIPNDAHVTSMRIHKPKAKMLVVSSDGRGFIVSSDDVMAQTKTGKQILNVSGKTEGSICRYVHDGDDYIAIIGTNRKMLIVPLSELPEMSKGRGVILQKYSKGSTLSDVKTFSSKKGLDYKYGSGSTTVKDITPWLGNRASVGKLPPNGFPKSNRFNYMF